MDFVDTSLSGGLACFFTYGRGSLSDLHLHLHNFVRVSFTRNSVTFFDTISFYIFLSRDESTDMTDGQFRSDSRQSLMQNLVLV